MFRVRVVSIPWDYMGIRCHTLLNNKTFTFLSRDLIAEISSLYIIFYFRSNTIQFNTFYYGH